MSENFWKSFPTPFKTFTKGFIKINSEISALSVYEEPHGISDRLIHSLAPAAILVPPPKMAFKIVLVRVGARFFIGDFGRTFFVRKLLKKFSDTFQNLHKKGYFD